MNAEEQIKRWVALDEGDAKAGIIRMDPEWERWLRRVVRIAIVYLPDRPYPTAAKETALSATIRALYTDEALEAAYRLGGYEALKALAMKHR